ncbi:septum formation family protein [Nocardioides sp. 1609]|uniref:septum formation family protein n=1 Tax=Nocardioides sp. 1609 TaxID=2508327 RepID=UPI001430A558|nr:septum formation family protein [Nocardioides sp. 1609]
MTGNVNAPHTRRAARLVVLVCLAVLALAGCSGDDDGDENPVLDLEVGDCVNAPEEIKAQVSDIATVPCDEPHDQEAYAVADYEPADQDVDGDVFPGDDALTAFADGRCAEEFKGYVGVDYLDSQLYFTYLYPSPRSWQSGDRAVVCLVLESGRQLDKSVKGTKL